MGVMMKTPTRYGISIPNRFAFGLNVYRNDCTAARQDFSGREERIEYERRKYKKVKISLKNQRKIVNFVMKEKQFLFGMREMIYDTFRSFGLKLLTLLKKMILKINIGRRGNIFIAVTNFGKFFVAF